MRNRVSNLREKYLDGEKLFRKYYEMGETRSIRMLTEWAILDGMKSLQGHEPTSMGVWKAMWRWASLRENHLKAWDIVSKANPTLTWGEWVKDMIEVKIPSAWQHPTIPKRERFLKENGWI